MYLCVCVCVCCVCTHAHEVTGESEDCSDTGKTYSHQHVKRAEVSAARGAGDASSSSHLPPANARPVPAASTDRQTAHLQQQVVPSLVPPLPLQPNPLSIPPPPGFVRQTLHVHSEADSGLKGGREGSSSNTSNVETETCPVRPTGISCQSSLLQNSVGSQRTAGQSQETHPNKLPVGFSVPGIEVSSASKPTGRGGNHSPHVQDSSRPSTHVQVSLGAWPAIHPHPSASRSSDTSQCGTEVVTTMSAAKADTMATGNPPSVLAAASSHQSPSHSSKHNHVQGNSSSTSESDNIAAHSSVDLSLQTAGLSGQAESNPEGRHQPSVYAHLSQSLYGSVPIVAHPGPNGFAIPPPFYPFHMGSHHPGIHPYILPVFPSLISTPGQVPPATHVQYEGFSSQVSGGGGGGMAVHPGIAQPQAAKEKAAGHRSNGLSMQEHSTGCYNCGAKDHSAASCPQSSMETMSGKSSYALDFTPQDTAEWTLFCLRNWGLWVGVFSFSFLCIHIKDWNCILWKIRILSDGSEYAKKVLPSELLCCAYLFSLCSINVYANCLQKFVYVKELPLEKTIMCIQTFFPVQVVFHITMAIQWTCCVVFCFHWSDPKQVLCSRMA